MSANVTNSSKLKLYDGSTPISLLTDASFSASKEMRDTTNKDSGGNREVCPALFAASFSFSAMHDFTATHGVSELWAKFIAGTVITAKFSTEVTGEKFFSASCYIASMEISSGGNEENVTYSGTLEVTGAVTEATVA
jgi:hypothetical protein